jgi:hypothetical protein
MQARPLVEELVKDLAVPVIEAFSRTCPERTGSVHEEVGDIWCAKTVGSSKLTEVTAVVAEESVL